MAYYRLIGDDTDAEVLSFPVTLNESVNSGDVLRTYIDGSSGLAERASSNGTSVIGIAVSSGSAGATIDIIQFGLAVVNFSETLSDSDIGKPVYLSSTPGEATLSPPSSSGSSLIRLGVLSSTDRTCLISPQTIIRYS